MPALNASGNDGAVGDERAGGRGGLFSRSLRGGETTPSETKVPKVQSATDSCLDFCFASLTLLAYSIGIGTLISAPLGGAIRGSPLPPPPPFKVDLVMSRTLGGKRRAERRRKGESGRLHLSNPVAIHQPTRSPVASRQSPVGQIVRHALQSYPLLVLTVNTLVFLVFLPYMPLLH